MEANQTVADVIGMIEGVICAVNQRRQEATYSGVQREIALVITKLQEARLWWEEAETNITHTANG